VAGVSDATVSRAINKPDTVSGATRERILQAIIETGYIPNRAAKAMASGRTHTVGALIPTLDHAIFAKFLNALEAELSTQGYGLIVAVTEGNPNIEIQKAEKLISMGVEGLVVSGLAHNDKLLNYTSRANTPIVATSYFEPTSNIPTVGYDNERAAKRAAQHLMSLGHQNIAVAHGPISNNDRTRSRIRALSAIGGNVRFRFIETTLDHVGGSAAAERLAPHDTALLCLSDVLAVGALHRLTTLNFSIPDDLSVMGFDNRYGGNNCASYVRLP